MKIAVISDTHNMLREEVKNKLNDCDLILHAGDICSPAIYDALTAIGKPMLAVRGNNDGRWAAEKGIPKVIDSHLSKVTVLSEGDVARVYGDLRIFVVHDRRDIPAEVLADGGGYDLVVFGHSHKYEEFYVGSTLFINPGSCGPVRFRLPVTMAVVEVSAGGECKGEKITFGAKQSSSLATGEDKSGIREISPGEMKTLVTKVVKDIKRNKSAEYIAKKHKISLELSQQICRLYLTHPGVTVDGILGKMGM